MRALMAGRCAASAKRAAVRSMRPSGDCESCADGDTAADRADAGRCHGAAHHGATRRSTGRRARYTRTAIALHWLAALLIVCGFALGLWMIDLPLSPAEAAAVTRWHKWIGITVFLTAPRGSRWRGAHPPPPPVPMPRVAAPRGRRDACAALRADARDSAVGLDLQLGHRRFGRLPRPRPAARPRRRRTRRWPRCSRPSTGH